MLAAISSAAQKAAETRVPTVEGGCGLTYKSLLGRIEEYRAKLPGRTALRMIGRRRFARRLVPVALAVVAAPLLIALRFGDPDGNTVDWPVPEFAEPSGIVYHPQRNSLFVVGDEGDIGEVSMDGKLLRQFHFGGDLEAVTADPKSGLLYVVRESHEVIFEVRPDDFKLLRRFTIDRSFEGDPNFLRRGGDGIEGLTFVPDDKDPEGGRFWAVNQFDPAVLVELEVALRTSKDKHQTARIRRSVPVDVAPLSEVTWDSRRREFFVASALWRRVVVIDSEGKQGPRVRIPGFMPEGIAMLPGGAIAIAQDSGGIVIWTPEGDPFAGGDAPVASTVSARTGEMPAGPVPASPPPTSHAR
jgi:uncharacterized protein YjiK